MSGEPEPEKDTTWERFIVQNETNKEDLIVCDTEN